MFSIVILSHKTPTLLHQCLESIQNATVPGGYEVIVVNDGGPEEINRIAEQFKSTMPLTCIRNPENKGVAYSRNKGILAATGQYITFSADNYTFEKEHFVNTHRHLQQYDVVCSNITTRGKGITAQALHAYYQFVIANWTRDARKVEHGYTGKKFPAGAASTFTASAIKDIGLFDSSLQSGEDSDYNLRLDMKGKKRIYVPKIIVYREENTSLWYALKKQYSYGRDFYCYRKQNNYKHLIRYEIQDAWYVVSTYLKTTGNVRLFPLAILLHGAFRAGIISQILKNK